MDREQIGRLLLWMGALAHCKDCLDDASIMELGLDCDVAVAEQEALEAHYRNETGRAFDPAVSYAGDRAVLAAFPRSTPMPTEYGRVTFHLRRLAVVYFLQLYKDGWGVSGVVAGNRKPQANTLRIQLEELTFLSAEEASKFTTLRTVLEQFRDGVIGHADGENFSVDHQETAVVSKEEAIPAELCAELRGVVERLEKAVETLMGRLLSTAPP